ncbi:putative sulfate exporter family transporter [uncultured Mailhella sp.]|uniref:YeiH family protein n=1 Tax=uncultured Mailhella sp. TaxID=1981031 RepID=UPI0026262A61|nr:putative sulfate exporter family transporter [uncultured Mailhella sp.]
MANEQDIVRDDGRAKWSDLWLKEDYWAIWVGFFFIIVAGIIMMNGRADIESKLASYNQVIAAEKAKPIQTIELIQAQAAKKSVAGSALPAAKTLIGYLATPAKWSGNPVDSFVKHANEGAKPAAAEAKAAAAAALEAAKTAQASAAAESFANADLNKAAETAIAAWQKADKASSAAAAKVGSDKNLIPGLIILGLGLGVITSVGMAVMGFNVASYFIGFIGVWILCLLANFLGGYGPASKYGLNAEIWSIIIGMVVSNTIGTPKWIKPAVQVEYFIKSGLVLLGAEVLFNKILAIGIPGIFVAWVVTPIVLISTYVFGQKVLKMESKTLNITISADMSVCGTSAAIAVAAACRAKKEELTLSVGLSMVFTAIMMVLMPAFIKAVGMPEILGGAWIGGTIDATGSVAAAGAFIGPKALQVAATIKMIQNVLIGVSAFCVAIYFATKVEAHEEGTTVGPMEIWNRFPKFVLGFLAASIILSTISGNLGSELGNALISNGVNKVTVPLRGWFFALAFVSIGLATNFKELAKYFKGGKPIILYVCGQSLNLCLTLLMAWIMFYKVFPEITASI